MDGSAGLDGNDLMTGRVARVGFGDRLGGMDSSPMDGLGTGSAMDVAGQVLRRVFCGTSLKRVKTPSNAVPLGKSQLDVTSNCVTCVCVCV